MVVVMGRVAVAGAGGGMGVLDGTEEVHGTACPLLFFSRTSRLHCEALTVGAIRTAETMLTEVGEGYSGAGVARKSCGTWI